MVEERTVYVRNESDQKAYWSIEHKMFLLAPGETKPMSYWEYQRGCANVTPMGAKCPLKIVSDDEGTLAFASFEREEAERELKEAKLKAASGGSGAEQVEQVNGATLVIAQVEGLEGNALRELMDQVRTRHHSAVILLASTVAPDKVAALVSVSADLPFDAGALFKTMLPALNGRGGGKKDLAQGGGTNPAGLPQAIAALRASM